MEILNNNKRLNAAQIIIYSLLLYFSYLPLFPQTGEWKEMHPLVEPEPRTEFSMAYLGDDKVIMFGGFIYKISLEFCNETWIYDLSDNTWTEIQCNIKPSVRVESMMTNIGNNKVMLYGGGENDYYNDTWIFDLNTLQWSEAKPNINPGKRIFGMSGKIGENQVLIYGGQPGLYYNNTTWIYDLNTNLWDSIETSLPYISGCKNDYQGREKAQMSEIDDHRVLLNGGKAYYNKYLNDNWIYDKKEGNWQKIYPKLNNYTRFAGSMSQLTEGKILLFGGIVMKDSISQNLSYGDDTWLFSIIDTSWTKLEIEPKPIGRAYYNMAHIADGKVLIFGGINGHDYTSCATTWLFEYEPTSVNEKINTVNTLLRVYNYSSGETRVVVNNLAPERIKLALYDINGTLIKNVYDDIPQSNNLELTLDGINLSSGVYFIRLLSKNISKFKSFSIVK